MECLLCARYYILGAGADVLVREMANKHTWMNFSGDDSVMESSKTGGWLKDLDGQGSPLLLWHYLKAV